MSTAQDQAMERGAAREASWVDATAQGIGWTFNLPGNRGGKFHFFSGGKSACGKFSVETGTALMAGFHESVCCAKCAEIFKARQANAQRELGL